MPPEKDTFYIATSYEQKERANKLARALMDSELVDLWPTFPWWMFSAEEDKHPKHMGAIGVIEINGAAEAGLFVWLYPARKGGWCELGAAAYTSAFGRRSSTKKQKILMVIPESVREEYQPPFAYQPDIHIQYVPDSFMDNTKELARVVLNYYKFGKETRGQY